MAERSEHQLIPRDPRPSPNTDGPWTAHSDAGRTVGDLSLHHDVGIGLRALLPQTSRELFRFDLAFPLDGPDAGLPRFIAGFQSEF